MLSALEILSDIEFGLIVIRYYWKKGINKGEIKRRKKCSHKVFY